MPGLQNSPKTLDYLGTIGTKDRGDAMPATAKALVELAGFLIETASDNLDRKANVATGGTTKSMRIVNLDLAAPKMALGIEILKTYKFLDQGVKGVGGVGRGKYQFRYLPAGKKMATAILKWLRKRGIRGGNYAKKYGAYGTQLKTGGTGKVERKDLRIHKQVNSAENFKKLAYAVATGIKKAGIEPTYFFTKAIKATEKESIKKYGEALKIDIIETLKQV